MDSLFPEGLCAEEIGRASTEIEEGIKGAEGRRAQAEERHAEVAWRRDVRRRELKQQRELTLQGVERLSSVIVLPHPERNKPDVQNLRPDAATEQKAMDIVMEHEQSQGRQVYDVQEDDTLYQA